MLKIKNLTVFAENKLIINSLDLEVGMGEVHAIMGPNGTGKSTLAHLLVGKEGYNIASGEVMFCGLDLLALSVDQRARHGLFLAFQHPIEIHGVSSIGFIKASLNAIRKEQNLPPIDGIEFLKMMRKQASRIGLDEKLFKRSLNSGFSGGEKKRLETLQLLMLKPKLAILDEIDSGLDVDALKLVADAINSERSNDRSFIIITHHDRLLRYIQTDKVHIFYNGKIVQSGGIDLSKKIEVEGYGFCQ